MFSPHQVIRYEDERVIKFLLRPIQDVLVSKFKKPADAYTKMTELPEFMYLLFPPKNQVTSCNFIVMITGVVFL